ncbi:MAG: hypothetical protein JRG91_20780, partial [Deltaproteobacteria bacterium]|nr:hypothetical protein [Deltaproteobacteria bacterium]
MEPGTARALGVLIAAALIPACGNKGSGRDGGEDVIEEDAIEEAADAPDPDAGDVDDMEVEAGSWDEPFAWTSDEAHECPAAVGPDDRYAELLAAAGLDRTAGLSRALYESFGGRLARDPTRLDVFHDLAEDPERIPCWTANLSARADAAVASDHPRAAVIAQSAAELGRVLTVGGRLPDVDGEAPLLEAIRAVHAAAGAAFDAEAEVRDAAAAVPVPVQRAAALILLAAVEARETLDLAMQVMGDTERLPQYYAYGSGGWLPGSGEIDPDVPWDAGMFLGSDEGSGRLFTGAVKLAQAVDEADLEAAAVDEVFSFSAATPWGLVQLR